MTAASTESLSEAATVRLKTGTRKLASFVMRGFILPVGLIVIAQLGLVARFNIWALSLWWLLPLTVLVALLASLVRGLSADAYIAFKLEPSAERRQEFREYASKMILSRVFMLLIPLVLLVSFLVLIFSRIAESIWVIVAGNQNYGYSGFGILSLVIVYLVSIVAVNAIWALTRSCYRWPTTAQMEARVNGHVSFNERWTIEKAAVSERRPADSSKWITRFLLFIAFVKVIFWYLRNTLLGLVIYTMLVPLAFTLALGCSIVINSGF